MQLQSKPLAAFVRDEAGADFASEVVPPLDVGVLQLCNFSEVRCGAVRCGVVRCGAVLCGAVWCGAVRCGAVRCGVVRCGAVR